MTNRERRELQAELKAEQKITNNKVKRDRAAVYTFLAAFSDDSSHLYLI